MAIEKIAVVGAGYMGRQISLQAAAHGLEVVQVDPAAAALEEARAFHAAEWARRGTRADNASPVALSYQEDLEAGVQGVDLVIEAAPEKIELKKELFARLDRLCPPSTLLATNSSSLRADQLEDALESPERLLNLHFFGVVWERPMVELMRGTHTTDAVIADAAAFVRGIGLVPLTVRRASTGFLFNRVWRAVKKETLHLVDQGVADFEDVDRAWRLMFGGKQGPFALMDAIGLDVVRDIEEVYWRESGDPADAPPSLLTDRVERGDLGVKSGRGFYTYPDPAYEREGWLGPRTDGADRP